MGVWKCRRCGRVTISDPGIPDGVEMWDEHLCMQCIFDDEEGHIVRGEK